MPVAKAAPSRYNKAIGAGRIVVSGWDEEDAEGYLDGSDATWAFAKQLLKEQRGHAVPFEDRESVEEGWRKVLIQQDAGEAGDAKAMLLTASGDLVDEQETPGGVLQLYEGNTSLQAQYGLYYRVAPAVVAAALDDEDEDDLAVDEGEGGTGATGAADAAARKAAVEAEPLAVECSDGMRLMWRIDEEGEPEAVTLRTREGLGDSTIAATKVRLLSTRPGVSVDVLRNDVTARLESGHAKTLTRDEDPEEDCGWAMDLLRANKDAIGSLYGEVEWCLAGETCTTSYYCCCCCYCCCCRCCCCYYYYYYYTTSTTSTTSTTTHHHHHPPLPPLPPPPLPPPLPPPPLPPLQPPSPLPLYRRRCGVPSEAVRRDAVQGDVGAGDVGREGQVHLGAGLRVLHGRARGLLSSPAAPLHLPRVRQE